MPVLLAISQRLWQLSTGMLSSASSLYRHRYWQDPGSPHAGVVLADREGNPEIAPNQRAGYDSRAAHHRTGAINRGGPAITASSCRDVRRISCLCALPGEDGVW